MPDKPFNELTFTERSARYGEIADGLTVEAVQALTERTIMPQQGTWIQPGAYVAQVVVLALHDAGLKIVKA